MTAKSQGRYPTRSRTPVADVCRYQNDGTEKIAPSRFIERAEADADDWETELQLAIDAFLSSGDQAALQSVADKIAADISRVCDRIRTGQLKASFEGKVESR